MSRTLELTDFTSTPVDIKAFIEDPQYLGEFAKDIYPYWKENLQEVYSTGPISPYVEVFLGGALGTGRTYAAIVGFLYDIYLFTLVRDPHEKYGIMPTIPINFVIVTEDMADTYISDAIQDIINLSPYFKSILKTGESLGGDLFPDKVGILHVAKKYAGNAYRGKSVAGLLLNDCMVDDTADKGIRMLRRRIITRYMSSEGQVPCRMWHASSMDMSSFYKYGSRITFTPSVWDVQAFKGIYCGETFSVFTGDDTEKPFILEEGKVYGDYLHGNVIHVPVEYREDFEKDIYTALQELAGIAVSVPAEAVKVPALTIVTNDLKLNLIALYALGMIMAFLLGYYCGGL